MSNESPVFGQEPYEWHYGRENDRILKLYPMSMADQLHLTGIIVDVMNSVTAVSQNVTNGSLNEYEFIDEIAKKVAENFVEVAAVVTGKPVDDPAIAELPQHVSNMQLMTFVNHLWEVNYGSVRKNFSGLFELMSKRKQTQQA